MAIVCLIGSARFEHAFHEAETKLTEMGHVVLSKDPIALARRRSEADFDPVELEMLHLVHLEKVRMADVVLIIDGDEDLGSHTTSAYIGESTAREILWAKLQNRVIINRQSLSGWGSLSDLIEERYAIENAVMNWLVSDAKKALSKVAGVTVLNNMIHQDVQKILHAGMSVLACNGNEASTAFATKTLEIAGLDPITDMPAVMPMFQDPPAAVDPDHEPNSVKFARRELDMVMARVDQSDKSGVEMQRMISDNILDMVRLFSSQGHSGFSASYAISAMKQLLNFEPLLPLTGEDDEWTEVGEGTFQNKRCSRVFKDSKGGQAYDIQGKVFSEPSGSSFTGKESRVYITFPYTPVTEHIKVLAERDAEGNVIPVPTETTVDNSPEFDQTVGGNERLIGRLQMAKTVMDWLKNDAKRRTMQTELGRMIEDLDEKVGI